MDYVENKEDCMKATGIVRRIDDLGRIVIPKEIRRLTLWRYIQIWMGRLC